MTQKSTTSIFSTIKIPTTDVYQNHLDKIHNLFTQFCKVNKSYKWALVVGKKNISAVELYLEKNQPETLTYVVYSADGSQELLLAIDNGISVNIKNGSHALYGLYSLVMDDSSSITTPHFIVFLRRYWLFNLFASLVFIPATLLSMYGHTILSVIWIILLAIGGVLGMLYYFYDYLPQYVDKEYDKMMKKVMWEKLMLSTKIRYGIYNAKLGSPIYSMLTSTKTLVSIVASLATILSFVVLTLQK
jgi:hypothetical protein